MANSSKEQWSHWEWYSTLLSAEDLHPSLSSFKDQNVSLMYSALDHEIWTWFVQFHGVRRHHPALHSIGGIYPEYKYQKIQVTVCF